MFIYVNEAPARHPLKISRLAIAFRRLLPAFETLSVAEMVHVSVRVPVHAGAMRFYRERGWLP